MRLAVAIALALVGSACSGKRASVVVVVHDGGVDAGAALMPPPPEGRYALAPGRGGCARTAAGAIECWGWASPMTKRLQFTPVKLDVGFAHARGIANAAGGRCAWSDTGEVACWGESVEHPVHPILGLHEVVEVTGAEPACARRRDGTVACWQQVSIYADTPPHEQLVEIPITGAVELARARRHPCARLATGEVKCWTMADPRAVHAMPDVFGALSLAVILEDSDRPGVPNDVMVALMPGGTLVAWETATNGVRTLAALPPDVQRIVPMLGTVCGFGRDRIACAGEAPGAPIVPLELTGIVDLVEGPLVSCAALRDHSARCWGHRGFLGDGDHEDRQDPIAVPGLEHVAQLAGRGGSPLCTRGEDGTVACWGWLGPRAPARDGKPTPVAGVSDAVDVAVTGNRACARSATGVVRCWGETFGPNQRWSWQPPSVVKALAGATALFGLDDVMCATVHGATTCDPELPTAQPTSRTLTGRWTTGSYGPALVCLRDATGVRCLLDRQGDHDWQPTTALGAVADARDLLLGDGMIAIVAHRDGSVWRAVHGVNAPVAGVSGALALAGSGDLDAPEDEVCALKAGGSVVCWTPDGALRMLPGVTDAVELRGARGGKCVRRQSGAVLCWGARSILGVGDAEPVLRSDPTPVRGLRI